MLNAWLTCCSPGFGNARPDCRTRQVMLTLSNPWNFQPCPHRATLSCALDREVYTEVALWCTGVAESVLCVLPLGRPSPSTRSHSFLVNQAWHLSKTFLNSTSLPNHHIFLYKPLKGLLHRQAMHGSIFPDRISPLKCHWPVGFAISARARQNMSETSDIDKP